MAANGVMLGVQLFIRLAEVPILLMLWGAVGYGEWLLIAALPATLSLSDGGFTKAAQREMTMRSGRNDQQGVKAVFQSSWAMLLFLTVVVIALVSLIVPKLPLASWLNITTTSSQGLTISLVALVAHVLIYFQCGLLYGVLASTGKYPRGVLLIAVSSFISFSGLIGGAISGGGIPAAACGSLLGQIVGYCVMLVFTIRAGVSPEYGFRKATLREIRLLWTPSIANLAFPIADVLSTQGLRLVIGLLLGPVPLAIFSTTRTLCRVALQPALSVARTLEPELSMAYGGGYKIEAKNLFLKSNHMGFWFSVSLSLIVVVIGPFFYQNWVGKQLSLDFVAFIIMLAASVISVLWGIALTVPCSINRHAPLALPFVCVYGIVPISIVFSLSHLGILGAALGVLLGDVLALMLIISLTLRVSGVSLGLWFHSTMKSPGGVFRNLMSRLVATVGKSKWS